jgi:hypothetical protein
MLRVLVYARNVGLRGLTAMNLTDYTSVHFFCHRMYLVVRMQVESAMGKCGVDFFWFMISEQTYCFCADRFGDQSISNLNNLGYTTLLQRLQRRLLLERVYT